MSKIFLGEPPANIKAWIVEHYAPAPVGNPKTVITFTDNTTQEFNWSGTITRQTMIDSGLMDEIDEIWIKKPIAVEISKTVTSIGDWAFCGCNTLTSVTILDSITSIGYNAFSGCSSLTNITLSSNLASIEQWAFSNCTNLTSITIPSRVENIYPEAFFGCSALTSVTFQGKTLAQVQAMTDYPWAIKDTSIINVA